MLAMMEAIFGEAVMCGADAQALAQLEQIAGPARDFQADYDNGGQPGGAGAGGADNENDDIDDDDDEGGTSGSLARRGGPAGVRGGQAAAGTAAQAGAAADSGAGVAGGNVGVRHPRSGDNGNGSNKKARTNAPKARKAAGGRGKGASK
jgi:hypothetical protein